MRHLRNIKSATFFLGLIVFLAVILRLYGVTVAVPHPDDNIPIQGAMYYGPPGILPSGHGISGLYVVPEFTLVYINILLFALYYCYGWLHGIFASMEAFRQYYLHDPYIFFLLGRLANVAFGVGVVYSLYYLGKRLHSVRVGLAAALFLAASFIHSSNSQFIRPDVPTSCFVVLALACCTLIGTNSSKGYLSAGILAGLATATKFTSGLLLFAILATHIAAEGKRLWQVEPRLKSRGIGIGLIAGGLCVIAMSLMVKLGLLNWAGFLVSQDPEINRRFAGCLTRLSGGPALVSGCVLMLGGVCINRSIKARNLLIHATLDRRILIAFIAFAVSFALFDPLFFVNFKTQMRVFLTDPNFLGTERVFVGVDNPGVFKTAWWYLSGAMSWGLGGWFTVMAAGGFIVSLSRGWARHCGIAVFCALYFIVICTAKYRWDRYVIPLIPFVALYAAIFLEHCSSLISHGVGNPARVKWLFGCAALAMVVMPSYNILRYDHLLTQRDTRTDAGEWIQRNIPPGTKIGQDAYTGEISGTTYDLTSKFSLSDMPYDFYLKDRFEYLIVSDTQYNRYFAERMKYPENVSFYERLFSEGVLVKEFVPNPDTWPPPSERFSKYHIHVSPKIQVYRLESR